MNDARLDTRKESTPTSLEIRGNMCRSDAEHVGLSGDSRGDRGEVRGGQRDHHVMVRLPPTLPL